MNWEYQPFHTFVAASIAAFSCRPYPSMNFASKKTPANTTGTIVIDTRVTFQE